MRRSNEKILVSHAGTLPRPADLQELFAAGPSRRSEFDQRLPSAVREVVVRQAEAGIDMVNDGELSKSNFTSYARDRLAGLEPLASNPGKPPAHDINARDRREFPEFFATGGGGFGRGRSSIGGTALQPMVCTGPITYVGRPTTEVDIANLKAAVEGLDVEPFLPAVAPGTIEHWLFNQHYPSDEEFLFALADAMHEEYKSITDAGLNLQIDDPDLPDGWQMFPQMSVDEY